MLKLPNQIFSVKILANPNKPIFTFIKNIIVYFIIPKKDTKFALTVLATLPIRTASQGGSFAFVDFSITDSNPSNMLIKAFLEGFSFCNIIANDL